MVETERVEFPGGSGAKLAGRLELPQRPIGYAIFAHCFTCSKDYKAMKWVSQTLAEAGIASLRFDFTGLGESGGDFLKTTFTSNLYDLVAAADFLRQEYTAPGLLVGHSLGGAAAIAVTPRIPEVRAVATIAAPGDVQHVRGMLLAQAPNIEDRDKIEVRVGGRPFHIGPELVEDLEAHCIADAMDKLRRPLLILHSPADATLSFDHARRLFEMARDPRSLIAIDAADHLLTQQEDAVWVGRLIATWAQRYLAPDPRPAAEPAATASEGGVQS